jgi:hypothetical protein
MLTRKDILGLDDLQYEDVPVPEWGGTIRMRGMTAADRDEFELAMMDLKPGRVQVRSTVVMLCAIDDKGRRLFQREDVEALGAKSFAVMNRLHQVAIRLSGLGPGAVNRAEKNFESDPAADSASA